MLTPSSSAWAKACEKEGPSSEACRSCWFENSQKISNPKTLDWICGTAADEREPKRKPRVPEPELPERPEPELEPDPEAGTRPSLVEDAVNTTRILQCDAFLDLFVETARAQAGSEPPPSRNPFFGRVYATCQATEFNIFHRDLAREEGGTPFPVAVEGEALSSMLGALSSRLETMLSPGDSGDICARAVPELEEEGALDALIRRVADHRARAETFRRCGPWYERVSQCVFGIAPKSAAEEGDDTDTPGPTALSDYEAWRNRWEKRDGMIGERLDRLGPMLTQLDARKLGSECP